MMPNTQRPGTGAGVPALLLTDPDTGGVMDHGPAMLHVIDRAVPDAIARLRADAASAKAVDDFLGRIGGEARIPDWLDLTRRHHSLLEDAHIERLRLGDVRKATMEPWSADAEACNPYTEEWGTVEELVGRSDVDDHAICPNVIPPPANPPCPYLLASKGVPWPGPDAEDVRDAAREAGKGNPRTASLIAEGVDVGLSEWWDGGRPPGIDLAGLEAVVTRWLPHLDTGDAVDAALEAELAAWTSTQAVSQDHPDEGRLHGTGPDVTQADCISWHEARIAALVAAADGLGMVDEAPARNIEAKAPLHLDAKTLRE